jgi:hypothetical protein
MSELWPASVHVQKSELWCASCLNLLHTCYNVGPQSEHFSVGINHGGYFLGTGSNRSYVDDALIWYDGCEIQNGTPSVLEDIVEDMGYDVPGRGKFVRILSQINHIKLNKHTRRLLISPSVCIARSKLFLFISLFSPCYNSRCLQNCWLRSCIYVRGATDPKLPIISHTSNS